MEKIINIVKATPLNNYNLYIEYADGFSKQINFLPFIKDGVSKQLLDLEMFNTVKVDFGTIVWQNGYDVCPVFLRNC
jgi:Protein of unknown function (DUF2442)